MIQIAEVTKRYSSLPVLESFSAEIPEGKITQVSGPSGCGKTTLLRLIAGLESPDSGVLYDDRFPMNSPQARLANRKIAFVFQENRLLEELHVIDNFRFVAPISSVDAENALKRFGLSGLSEAPVSSLSGGMKRRIALLRALLFGGNLVLLDEPFAHLDLDCKKIVQKETQRLLRGKTVVFVSHEQDSAELFQVEHTICIPDLSKLRTLSATPKP